MSTHCMIHFVEAGEKIASIYRHSDGYPEPNGVLKDLETFFQDVLQQAANDTRFDDASYLAAKFVVWQAKRYRRGDGELHFLGVGIMSNGPRCEYEYLILCDRSGKKPAVTWKESG